MSCFMDKSTNEETALIIKHFSVEGRTSFRCFIVIFLISRVDLSTSDLGRAFGSASRPTQYLFVLAKVCQITSSRVAFTGFKYDYGNSLIRHVLRTSRFFARRRYDLESVKTATNLQELSAPICLI